MINKSSLFIIFLLVANSGFSQKLIKTDKEALYSKGKAICDSYPQKTLCKAFEFYLNKAFDSCYVYSSKGLLETLSYDEREILNYIQGVSALNKRLHKKALQNFRSISDTSSFKSLKYLKLGQAHLILEDYDSAVYYYQKWNLDNSHTDLTFKKNGYHNLGLSYIHKKDYKNANKYFDKELELIDKTDTLEIITNKMELANIYYNKFQDDIAIPLFEESYELAKLFSDLELKQNTSRNLAVVEKNRKDFEKSIEYLTEYNRWKDSIWNRDRIWELTEREKEIAIAQKQSEIALQEEKLKQQHIRNRNLIIGSSILIIFIGILVYFYRKLTIKNRLITNQREELKNVNKTKDYLFSVVSHDLRSPVISLKKQLQQLTGHISQENIPEIEKTTNIATSITEDTFHLLNNVLHWSLEQSDQLMFNQNTISLKPLVEQAWYNFQAIAEAKQVEFHNELNDEILIKADKESFKIILRNLFDNAIKYTKQKGEITVKEESFSNNKISVTVEDSGIGISKERVQQINDLQDLSIDKIDRSKGIGLGLLLCHSLAKKNQSKLIVHSEPDVGTKVKIIVPLVND